MKKKEFKSSSKRVLDLMINSIYTNKEIFLRELLSNASDALDKLSYKALTDNSININKADLEINIIRDSDNRILTIKDKDILWFIPISSKVDKYKKIIDKKVERYGFCNTIIIRKIADEDAAILL